MIDLRDLPEQQRRCIPDVTFELLPINTLVSNQDYQRPLSEKHIRKTLEEFDVYQINPVKVSRRQGVNYVFDGQHTAELIAEVSGSRSTPVWCMIFSELEYVEEAHVFSEQQKHVKKLTPYEIYIAHIEAGDAKQLLIQKITQSYGLEITSARQPSGICAINALEYIYDKYGQTTLDKTLRLAVKTWEGERLSLSGGMLKGIAKVVVSYGDSVKEDVFVDNVGKYPVSQIIRTARERRSGHLGYAEALVLAYNGKRKHKLSLRTLYGGKNMTFEDEYDEQEESTEENNTEENNNGGAQ